MPLTDAVVVLATEVGITVRILEYLTHVDHLPLLEKVRLVHFLHASVLVEILSFIRVLTEYDGYESRAEERGDAGSRPAPRYRRRANYQPNYYRGGGGTYNYNPGRSRRPFPPAHRNEEGNVSNKN